MKKAVVRHVRYKVKKDRVRENETLIVAVFKALDKQALAGVRYSAFKLEDGVSFVHIASFDADLEGNPLASLPEFQAFLADLPGRCDEPPAVSIVSVVGQYEMS